MKPTLSTLLKTVFLAFLLGNGLRAFGQVNNRPKVYLNLQVYHFRGVSACPAGLALGLGYNHHSLDLYYARWLNRRLSYLSEGGFRYRYSLAGEGAKFSPFLGTGIGLKRNSLGWDILGAYSLVSLRAHFGFKYFLFGGFYGIFETGLSNRRLYAQGWAPPKPPGFKLFMSTMIGMGYEIPLVKKESRASAPLTISPAWDSLSAPSFPKSPPHRQFSHQLGMMVFLRREWGFFPSKSYKFQYSFSPRPDFQVFAGIDWRVSQWLLPGIHNTDTTAIEGGRLGFRYLPGKPGRRLQYFGEFSAALGRRNAYIGFFPTDNDPYMQYSFGNGVFLRLFNQFYLNVGVQYGWAWTFLPRRLFFNEEHELNVGISYRLGSGSLRRKGIDQKK